MTQPVIPDWRLETHDVVDSTNERAIAAVTAGAAPGLAILARRQTAGRGRRGHRWESLEGNLHLSVVLPRLDRLRDAASLVIGVAVHEAVLPLLPPATTLSLKWPNDLVVAGAKLGGILVEGAYAAGKETWLVAGIGLNLCAQPHELGRDVTSLAALGGEVPGQVEMAHAVLAALTPRLAAFAAEGLSARLREAWMERSFPLGETMSFNSRDGMILGRYCGLAEDGSLVIEVGGKRTSFIFGDVAPGT